MTSSRPSVEVPSDPSSTSTSTAPVSREGLGALVVALAVLWQGIGTGVVGHVVAPEHSVLTTATAFLVAAVVGVAGWQLDGLRRGNRPRPGPLLVTWRSVRHRAAAWIHPLLVLVLAGVTATLILAEASRSGVDAGRLLLGTLLWLAAGVCAVGVLLVSKSMASRGIEAWEISAVRFHIVWTAGLALTVPGAVDAGLSAGELTGIVLVGAAAIAGPILLLQWGVTLAKTLHAALLLACLPAVVLAADLVLGAQFPSLVVAGVVGIVLVSVWSTIRDRRQAAG
ncbi:hypothetical protein [Nesterenkonia sp. F]|uniref:hypothetical protein n=1 Tax=Nesterenkonia sp. F TaxID=795955 RepID=UPI0003067937|nr:hypothetical protein [Nesterenkonia sp. F]